MQIGRLFEIVYILLDKKMVTSAELAERFEVSRRTIYRDIETLSAAGIPVYMKKGKGGGISLLPNFILNKAVLSHEEKNNILLSLQAIKSSGLHEMDNTFQKMSSMFGSLETDWIEVEFSPWENEHGEDKTFNRLKSAILKKQIVVFMYANVKGERSMRRVEPLKLYFKGSAWYLYGYCTQKEDYRIFKLSRIKELCITDSLFQRKAPSQIPIKENIFIEDYVSLTLRLSAEMAYRVYDEFTDYKEQEDGSFIVQIDFPKGKWLYSYIGTFGSGCEVLKPIEIRNQVRKDLQKSLKQYL